MKVEILVLDAEGNGEFQEWSLRRLLNYISALVKGRRSFVLYTNGGMMKRLGDDPMPEELDDRDRAIANEKRLRRVLKKGKVVNG